MWFWPGDVSFAHIPLLVSLAFSCLLFPFFFSLPLTPFRITLLLHAALVFVWQFFCPHLLLTHIFLFVFVFPSSVKLVYFKKNVFKTLHICHVLAICLSLFLPEVSCVWQQRGVFATAAAEFILGQKPAVAACWPNQSLGRSGARGQMENSADETKMFSVALMHRGGRVNAERAKTRISHDDRNEFCTWTQTHTHAEEKQIWNQFPPSAMWVQNRLVFNFCSRCSSAASTDRISATRRFISSLLHVQRRERRSHTSVVNVCFKVSRWTRLVPFPAHILVKNQIFGWLTLLG